MSGYGYPQYPSPSGSGGGGGGMVPLMPGYMQNVTIRPAPSMLPMDVQIKELNTIIDRKQAYLQTAEKAFKVNEDDLKLRQGIERTKDEIQDLVQKRDYLLIQWSRLQPQQQPLQYSPYVPRPEPEYAPLPPQPPQGISGRYKVLQEAAESQPDYLMSPSMMSPSQMQMVVGQKRPRASGSTFAQSSVVMPDFLEEELNLVSPDFDFNLMDPNSPLFDVEDVLSDQYVQNVTPAEQTQQNTVIDDRPPSPQREVEPPFIMPVAPSTPQRTPVQVSVPTPSPVHVPAHAPAPAPAPVTHNQLINALHEAYQKVLRDIRTMLVDKLKYGEGPKKDAIKRMENSEYKDLATFLVKTLFDYETYCRLPMFGMETQLKVELNTMRVMIVTFSMILQACIASATGANRTFWSMTMLHTLVSVAINPQLGPLYASVCQRAFRPFVRFLIVDALSRRNRIGDIDDPVADKIQPWVLLHITLCYSEVLDTVRSLADVEKTVVQMFDMALNNGTIPDLVNIDNVRQLFLSLTGNTAFTPQSFGALKDRALRLYGLQLPYTVNILQITPDRYMYYTVQALNGIILRLNTSSKNQLNVLQQDVLNIFIEYEKHIAHMMRDSMVYNERLYAQLCSDLFREVSRWFNIRTRNNMWSELGSCVRQGLSHVCDPFLKYSKGTPVSDKTIARFLSKVLLQNMRQHLSVVAMNVLGSHILQYIVEDFTFAKKSLTAPERYLGCFTFMHEVGRTVSLDMSVYWNEVIMQAVRDDRSHYVMMYMLIFYVSHDGSQDTESGGSSSSDPPQTVPTPRIPNELMDCMAKAHNLSAFKTVLVLYIIIVNNGNVGTLMANLMKSKRFEHQTPDLVFMASNAMNVTTSNLRLNSVINLHVLYDDVTVDVVVKNAAKTLKDFPVLV